MELKLAVAAVALSSAACSGGGMGLVARYPYVEDQGLALAHETLSIDVERDGSVNVSALFRFVARGAPRDRVMTFPVAGPRGAAQGFAAELVGREALPLPVAPSEPGHLPVGDAAQTWDLWVGGAELARHDGWLRVRYTQRGNGDFAYTLKSGAYWSGPIERLEVLVTDPHGRIASLSVEGRRVDVAGRARVAVELTELEPVHGVRLELK
ncbi:MAG: hypothetical protein HS104_22970 [Polyangiaceae bacterium]|nr:hypothetical protein [Polyangiaceae bacterium]MCE7892478.1 hypothetical protein [Sorangiineae bacterium PRO1]MCL4755742.1 hypothetical protein [Myxococcales bacterium]